MKTLCENLKLFFDNLIRDTKNGEKTPRLMFYFLFLKKIVSMIEYDSFFKFVKEVTIFFFTYNVWLSISRIA